jgi:Fe-S-cluster containining protein
MSSFEPVFKADLTIDFFNCTALNENNLCKHYAIRPDICRQYPYSLFATDSTLYNSCGYKLVQRFKLPYYASKKIRQRISVVVYNNITSREK